MFTLDIKKYKTVLVYLAVSVFAVIVDKVYAIFGHGVSSGYMTWMFLYPLLGGVLFYLLIGLLAPNISINPGYRVFYNLYNSGIALLMIGSLMKGVFEIAGTNSPYANWYYGAGFLFLVVGIIVLLISFVKQKEYR